MSDYTPTTWVDDVTQTSAANLNHIEAGLLDASKHHKRDTLANLPAAAAANKNWLYEVIDTGQFLYSDGSSWFDLTALPYGYQSAVKVCAHATMASGAQFKTSIDNAGGSGGAVHPWGKRVEVFRVSTDQSPGWAARVRCYATVAQRDADASRLVGVDPASGTDHGLLLEVITSNTQLSFDLSPVVGLYNRESPRTATIPITIDNLDVVTRTVAVYFDFQVLEP